MKKLNKYNLFIICILLGAATMSVCAQTWNCGYPIDRKQHPNREMGRL